MFKNKLLTETGTIHYMGGGKGTSTSILCTTQRNTKPVEPGGRSQIILTRKPFQKDPIVSPGHREAIFKQQTLPADSSPLHTILPEGTTKHKSRHSTKSCQHHQTSLSFPATSFKSLGEWRIGSPAPVGTSRGHRSTLTTAAPGCPVPWLGIYVGSSAQCPTKGQTCSCSGWHPQVPRREALESYTGALEDADANGRHSEHPLPMEAHSCQHPTPQTPCHSCAAWEGVSAWRTQGFLWPLCIQALLLPDVRSFAGASPAPLAAASGRAWRERGAAGAVGQQLCVNTGLHSRSDLTASLLQAEAINALCGCDARLHPFLNVKKKRGRKERKTNKKALLQFSGRFRGVFLADPGHGLQAPCWSTFICTSFTGKVLSCGNSIETNYWKRHPFASDQNRRGSGFFFSPACMERPCQQNCIRRCKWQVLEECYLP